VDAIVVGIGTVLADDPALTVRLDGPWPREPYRVVLDSTARTPPAARLIAAGAPDRAVIAVGADAPDARIEALRTAGARIVRCAGPDGRVSPPDLLATLFGMDVRGVLVEGGAEVAASFLDAGLVDRVAVLFAPKLLGGAKAPSILGGAGRALNDALTLGPLAVRQIGDDVMIEADVRRG
jgi:diaminohydroxyphosphoribosylaminopyrimidine deaminase/5-amino-6-(5-phosphoribosylamino)uracil reductase